MPHRPETDRVSDSHRPDSRPDTGHILQQLTPQDIRASNERQNADRNREAQHPALPPLEICDARDGNPLSRIVGLPFDRDHNGRTSRVELEQALNTPGALRAYPCAGEAVAALRNNFNSVARLYPHDNNDGITLNDVVALQRLPQNHDTARSVNRDMSAIINNSRSEGLFDRNGAVTPDAVDQGNLGDCTLMATLASLANNDRGRRFIQEMIQPHGDGFRVHFGNGQTIDTTRPSPFEMGTYSRDSGRGIWPNVLERTFGIARNNDIPLLQSLVESVTGNTRDQLRPHAPTESLFASQVFATMFGDRAISVQIQMSSVDNDDQLHTQLAIVSPNAMAMVTNTVPDRFTSDTPPGNFPMTFVDRIGGRGGRDYLRPNHSYMFDHYDAGARDVYLRNPWRGDEVLRMPLKTYRSMFLNFDAVLDAGQR